MKSELITVENLKVHFRLRSGLFQRTRGEVRAVDGVNLALGAGETLALVGESGCGKTTLARAILGLAPVTSGRIVVAGRELSRAAAHASAVNRRVVQMVFQDPFDSLNPRKTIFQTLAQPLRIHRVVPRGRMREEAARLLDLVGLNPGAAYLDRFAHQFSGGQRQRICIARAIAVRPQVIVADEAVSALDISIRAQILTLLKSLQREMGLAYLFITHDLGVVRSLADRVTVMYLGQVVEEGPTDDLFRLPRHPYTRALLTASPLPDPVKARARKLAPLAGDVPSPLDPPGGCRFHPRCPHAKPVCISTAPEFAEFERGQRAACHFAADAQAWR